MSKRSKSASIKRSASKRRWLLAAIATLVLLIAASTAYTLTRHRSPGSASSGNPSTQSDTNNKIDYSPASPADNAANDARKGSTTPSSTIDSYQSPPNTGSFSVTVTRAGVYTAGQELQVATLISGVATGTCTLNVHQAGQQTVTQSENITLQVNSYTCPVFNVPLSDFSNRGSWNVSVTVTSGGKTVSSDWANNPVSLGG